MNNEDDEDQIDVIDVSGDTNGFPNVELARDIGRLAVRAARVDVSKSVHVIQNSPDNEHCILINKNGDHQILRKAEPARRHSLLSIADVSRFASAFKAGKNDEGDDNEPIIWVGKTRVIITNDNDRLRHDTAEYVFALTPAYEALQKLSDSGMDQPDFLRFLRVTFARAFEDDDLRRRLIRAVRAVRTSQNSVIGQGSGSYEVGAQTSSNEPIDWPDSFMVRVQVLDDPSIGTERLIEVILDVRPEDRSGMFRLTPVKQDMLQAYRDATTEAVDYLTADADGIPIYRGAPVV